MKGISKDKLKKIIVAVCSASLLLITVLFFHKPFSGKAQIALFALVAADALFFALGIALGKDRLYKISILAAYFAAIIIVAVSLVLKSGILEQIDTAEDLIAIINGFGMGGKLIFILIQFLQVTFIPIPSTIVTAAGAALYSPWEALLLSSIGLWLGSFTAFGMGRIFGVKLVKWIIGEEMLLKYNGFVKGKDKAMLFYMFLFPVFPDDMLCMLAGLTTMSWPVFIFIQLISRPLNVACTVFALDYLYAVPFSGWGIAIWAAIFIFFVLAFILMWKYSEKVEKALVKLISKITGRPVLKDIYSVYNIYNSDNEIKGIGYTEQTPTQSSNAHKARANIIATEKEREEFENNYNTITAILEKKDDAINF